MNEDLEPDTQRIESARIKLADVHANIQSAATDNGAETQTIRVIGASKAQPIGTLRAFAQAGLKHFGENFLQEALPKIETLQNEDIEWHFIGRVQSNKAKQIATHFAWVQTIDSSRLAQRLSHFRVQTHPDDHLNCCVQVNLDDEPQKAGVSPEEVQALVEEIDALPGLRLRGLMAIPAPQPSPRLTTSTFNRLRELFEKVEPLDPEHWDTLSMGMSSDYERAIRSGSNMVRLGTTLFGPRKPRPKGIVL